MNPDLTGGVYKKSWEMFWGSSYKYQQAAVQADWLCGVGEVEPLLNREQADINIQRNVHKRRQIVFHGSRSYSLPNAGLRRLGYASQRRQ